MKRTPLTRRTPLVARSSLRATTALRRKALSAAVRPVTALRRSGGPRVPGWVRTDVRGRSRGRCEAMVSPGCTRRGEHLHHRQMNRSLNTVANLLDVCHVCHRWIHDHPQASYDRGLLVRKTERVTEYRRVR